METYKLSELNSANTNITSIPAFYMPSGTDKYNIVYTPTDV
jgi:hypothetical protein